MLFAGPAAAATGNISNIDVTRERIQLVFEATETEGAVAADSVTLTIDGVDVPAEAQPVGAADATITLTTMLVMDTSGSMDGNGRLAGAKQAARAFVESAPEDMQIGLITFDNGARVVRPATTDRDTLVERHRRAPGGRQHGHLRRGRPGCPSAR